MIGINLGGRYELLELIGEGGMAVVYKAHCQVLDRIVAVKILKDEFSKDAGFVEKFRTEALAAAQLSHPNIMSIYDVGQDNDVYYIVMEYIEGMNLKELIRADAPFTIAQAINVASMVLDGLHQAHERGIIHRDIKPQNIIITNDGVAKVADFGIAKATTKKTITFNGDIIGSVHYIAPEQAKGEPVSRATDLYSTSCIIYEMLTGRMPFDAESTITVALKHIHELPLPPHEINPDIPRELEAIIMRAMDKDPALRYGTAQDMRMALVDFYRRAYPEEERFRTDGERLDMLSFNGNKKYQIPDKKKKHKLRKSSVIIIVLAIVGVLSGYLYSNGGLFGEETEVPDVQGLITKEAEEKLRDYNLKMKVISQANDNEVEEDHVIRQDPAPESKVKAGRVVEVVISKGKETMPIPSVVGLMRDDAENMIKTAGFNVGEIYPAFDDKYPENSVVSQAPDATSTAVRGTAVDLRISRGKTPSKVKVPNLVNYPLETAKMLLENSKLDLGEVTREENAEYDVDRISGQSIAMDTMVDENTKIDITLSNGAPKKTQPDTPDGSDNTSGSNSGDNSGNGNNSSSNSNNPSNNNSGSGNNAATNGTQNLGPVITRTLEFTLPDDNNSYQVQIKVKDAQGEKVMYNQQRKGGDLVAVAVSFYKSCNAEVTLNGIFYKSFQLQ
ncbi:MAG: Stk1 family PASTA domain-containing Ser/Thr kinase [Syntrophomonadaceae bacterium]|nr:Stk1 family PASTA domain-containing Ser/Thr kinase [Syntrophomonadaceae bacterium]